MAKLPFNNRNAFNALANNTNRGRRPKFSINYINKVTVKEPKPLELNYPGAVREEEVKPLVLNYYNKTKKDSIQIGGNNRKSFTIPLLDPVIPNMIIEDQGNNPFIVAEDRIFIFNITWDYNKQPSAPGSDFTTVPVTAFPLDGVIQGNTRDRPRINIFPDPQLNDYGSDSAFLSAGYGYQIEAGGVAGLMAGAPWGNRASGTETLSTNAKDGGPVGVDIFTVDWFPDPVTTPSISEDVDTVVISNATSSSLNGSYVKRTIDGQVRYGQTDFGLQDSRYIFFDTGTSKWSFFNGSNIGTLPSSITESDGFWTAGVNDWTGAVSSSIQGATYITSSNDNNGWVKTTTGNPTEVKFQKLYTEPGNYDITINIYKPDGYNISFAG